MAPVPKSSCGSRLLNLAASMAIIGVGIAVFFHTEDPNKRLSFGLVMLMVLIGLTWSWLQPRILRRRVRQVLASRPPMDAATFAEAYFRDVPHGQVCAVAVHRQLEQHIGVDLSGLRPEDTLKEIHAQLDPVFFSYLGEVVGVSFPITSSREFTSMISSLVTVRDLVELTAQLVARDSNGLS